MYLVTSTSGYRKSFKRVARNNGFDNTRLNEVINTLARGEALPPKFRNHGLKSSYEGFYECHIQNDLLLVYEIIEHKLVLVLINIGSQSDLF